MAKKKATRARKATPKKTTKRTRCPIVGCDYKCGTVATMIKHIKAKHKGEKVGGTKAGRSRIEFSEQQMLIVEKYAAVAAPNDEIAAALDVSPSVVDERIAHDPEFKAAIEKGRAKGRLSIRGKQFALAMDGNPTMLIWVGKQMLGQSDKAQIQTGSIDRPDPGLVTIHNLSEVAELAKSLGIESLVFPTKEG